MRHAWRDSIGYSKSLAVSMVAAVLSLLLFGAAAVRSAHGQVDVVRPEDVTTPVPTPVKLAPTAMPAMAGQAGPGGDGALWAETTDEVYVVREGDTLWSVALEMGLDLDEMPCLIDPYFRTDMPLVIGNRLVQPSGQMTCHLVQPGESLLAIAAMYGVGVELMMGDPWNQLGGVREADAPLAPGRYVRIVTGRAAPSAPGFFVHLLERPIDEPPLIAYATGGPTRSRSQSVVPEDWPYGSGYFDWPTYGWITQGYRNDHRAIDIAAPTGTFVTAADRGVVVRAGWNDQGYGMFVIIDHNIDYVTLYSHLQDIFVKPGEIVAQGQIIGTVGSTGNSTGPHLHFEVRDFGSRINPLEVLLR